MSLTRGVVTVGLEVLGLLGAIGLVAALTLRRRPTRVELRFTTVVAVGALTLALALDQLATAGSTLNQTRRGGATAQSGLERCFTDGEPAGPRLPFVRWLKARMGAHAVYVLDRYTSPPDPLCLYLVLLPALPAGPGEHADWRIAFGEVGPEMQARIVQHDPSVRVFAPGLALERDGVR